MTQIVNVHEAKTHLSRLLARVRRGEEIVIARYGEPVAKLVPVRPAHADREPGIAAGRIRMADDFEDLPEGFLRAFHGDSDPRVA